MSAILLFYYTLLYNIIVLYGGVMDLSLRHKPRHTCPQYCDIITTSSPSPHSTHCQHVKDTPPLSQWTLLHINTF